VDLGKGGGSVEATIERERRFVLTVRTGGVPRLPARYTVALGHAPVAIEEEDAEAGRVRFRWRPPPRLPSPPKVLVKAPGFLPAEAAVAIGEPGTEIPVAVDLLPASRVMLRVVPPTDDSGRGGAFYQVELQRWDEAKREWAFAGYDSAVRGGMELVIDVTGVGRLESLPPGRYRFIDKSTGQATDPFVAVARAEPTEVRLDLSGSGWVTGRVVVPEGESVAGTRVRRTGGPSSLSPFGGDQAYGVDRDGNFKIRVPGGVPTTIEAVHPLLSADPAGRAVVTGPADRVVLRLEATARAVVRLDGGVVDPRLGAAPGVAVLLYRGEPEGASLHKTTARVEGGRTVRFGGFAPGTYTVWIDADPFAPVVLRDVALGEGETDLGAVTLEEGRKVRLRILAKEGEPTGHVSVWATRKGEPTYRRAAYGRDAKEGVWVSGLGSGVFDVSASTITTQGPKSVEETVDLTSATEATLTLDLR
jgi:hypothetical protein